MGFKDNLKEEMFYSGITTKELATRTGISQGSLSNYLKENSSIPSADIAVKIAKALNVSVEYLVTGKNNVNNNELSSEKMLLLKKIETLSNHDKHIIYLLLDVMNSKFIE